MIDAEKNREYQARWYKANKETHFSRVKERERKIAEWLKQYKSTLSCEKCGESHEATLDFHHRDSTEKESNIANAVQRGWGKKRILEEIDKCAVLCSNCHRRLHWEERNGGV